MITPNIAPRKIMGSATAGLFSAAKSSVRRMERTTNTLSKAADVTKDQRLGINYVQFFGSKKNAKILKKSLKAIRDSLIATFAIAKLLRSEVSKNVKLIGEKTKGKRGLFGIGGGILGTIGTLLNVAKFLANPVVLKVLGIAALVGGTFTLGKFLFDNRDSIKEFIFSRAKGIYDFMERLVSGIVERIIGKTFKSDVLSNVESESDVELEKEFQKLKTEDEMPEQDAMLQATLNEIQRLEGEKNTLIKALGDGTSIDGLSLGQMRKRKEAIDTRIKDLQTGDSTLDELGKPQNILTNLFFGNQIKERSTTQGAYLKRGDDYESKSPKQKLKMLKALKKRFETQGDPEQIKIVYAQDLIQGNLKDYEIPQAMDMIELADQLDAVKGDMDKIKVDDFNFSDGDLIKPISKLEDLIKSKTTSSPTKTSVELPKDLSSNVMPKKVVSSGTDVAQNISPASSAPSLRDFMNFNPDNDLVEYNASLLNIYVG
tara:strand:- start:3087 stop:4544 length:1458 start_codon:yes stop_codon:yes gene_type:complete